MIKNQLKPIIETPLAVGLDNFKVPFKNTSLDALFFCCVDGVVGVGDIGGDGGCSVGG